MSAWVTDVVEAVGYAGIAALMLLEMWVPVVQSEIVMTFSGFAARTGDLSLLGAVAAGVAGTQVGAMSLFAVSRAVPEERVRGFLARHGDWVGLDDAGLRRLEDRFRDNDVRAVVVGRFLPGVRGVIAVPAGLLGMGAWRFFLACLGGATAWTAGLAVAGYLLGSQYRLVDRYSTWLSLGFGAVVVGLAVWWVVTVVRRKRARAAT